MIKACLFCLKQFFKQMSAICCFHFWHLNVDNGTKSNQVNYCLIYNLLCNEIQENND